MAFFILFCWFDLRWGSVELLIVQGTDVVIADLEPCDLKWAWSVLGKHDLWAINLGNQEGVCCSFGDGMPLADGG